jgi:hypothetical protein
MKLVLLIGALVGLLIGCSAENSSNTDNAADKAAATSNTESISLEVGESIEVPALRVTIGFDTVLEDSRCPVDVECVWEGNARVGLQLVSDELYEDIELNTAEQGGATTYSHNGYAVSIEKLEPRPTSTTPIDSKLYHLTLKIRKQ